MDFQYSIILGSPLSLSLSLSQHSSFSWNYYCEQTIEIDSFCCNVIIVDGLVVKIICVGFTNRCPLYCSLFMVFQCFSVFEVIFCIYTVRFLLICGSIFFVFLNFVQNGHCCSNSPLLLSYFLKLVSIITLLVLHSSAVCSLPYVLILATLLHSSYCCWFWDFMKRLSIVICSLQSISSLIKLLCVGVMESDCLKRVHDVVLLQILSPV